ncbi:hypothetical protein AOR01nite_25700 [Acetobacter orleanensis]|uniref:Uncharacterized protein n=1 Tax=Acetobacter orleanensis TaxID=104099 RepID=A0A4Y3TQS7_9PROT|nr:hypothetical protein Abol_017_005 [Acetobacter orleanensis JCM 7639]GEB84093.1 hypothetical protein AOR01nite_25700 [Acetobacter orleanensis]
MQTARAADLEEVSKKDGLKSVESWERTKLLFDVVFKIRRFWDNVLLEGVSGV